MGVQARQQPYEFIMAVGKNKKLMKGKKGGKKKIIDPFTRKEWYDVKAPNLFKNRQVGKTLVTRTIGTKIASANLKGRVRKWQSLIEATMDVKTTDGYVLRLFCIGFTMNRQSQCDLKDLVTKLVPNTIGKKIEKRCTSIY